MSFTPNRVLATNATGNVVSSNVTATELSYFKSVTSNVQAQLDALDALDNIGVWNNWQTSNVQLESSTLAFTPLPGRHYLVDARLLAFANTSDYTASIGFRWPTPLASKAGVVSMSYPSSDVSNTVTQSMTYAASANTDPAATDPAVTMRLGTLANVPIPITLKAMFTTANVANITPCAVVANVSSNTRMISLLYGSHVSYRSVPLDQTP